MSLYKWSQTAASNATSDPSINWQEGQAPSSVNDSARAMMASVAKHRDDVTGAIATGGTSTAYTVASYEAFDTLSRLGGQIIAFSPHATNGGAVTLNVDSLGARPLRPSPGVELQAGTLIQGTPYLALYNHSDGVFYLHGFYGNAYNVPLAAGLDYWGATTPNSAFAFPVGQAISRATYSSLFAIMGTTYGTGDGSTTFNLPDKTGRVSAMKEASATRLSGTYFVGNSTNLGAVGGADNKTLLTANLPAYTPSGSISGTALVGWGTDGYQPPGGGSKNAVANISNVSLGASVSLTVTATFIGSAQGGTSTPFATVQPTIICNYIIRII